MSPKSHIYSVCKKTTKKRSFCFNNSGRIHAVRMPFLEETLFPHMSCSLTIMGVLVRVHAWLWLCVCARVGACLHACVRDEQDASTGGASLS